MEYARENVESMKKVVVGSGEAGGTDDSYTASILSKIFDFIKRLLYLGAAFIIFTMIFRSVTYSLTLIIFIFSSTTSPSMRTTNLR